MDTLTTTVADSVSTTTSNAVPHFGVFEQLANYGALGLCVLALGAVCWMFIKRQLDEKDRLQKKLDEMNKAK
jgi:hypothetical protein